jgi:hypothetical protein
VGFIHKTTQGFWAFAWILLRALLIQRQPRKPQELVMRAEVKAGMHGLLLRATPVL